MREIIAIIRNNKVASTKKALVDAGIPALTGVHCHGRGHHGVDFTLQVAPTAANTEACSAQAPSLLPKYLLNIAVPKNCVKRVVDIIAAENHTGTAGDGKIFVLPIEETIRMRTGETGHNALDEMA
ncbi:MAG: P-II family nitrogen regulator [Pseudomonadota bacterium]